MSKDTQKKRKRNDGEADTTSPRPEKAQKTSDTILANDENPDAKKRGESRQAKSERRSKKTKSIRKNDGESTRSANKNAEEPLPTVTNGKSTALDNVVDSNGCVTIPDESKGTSVDVATNAKKEKKKKSSKAQETLSTTPRFIVFVGNLPYDATTPQIEEHFLKVAPFQVRHRVDKKTGQSRGFAFIEFEDYDKMKTTLQLYHHSIFDPNAKEKGLDTEEDLKSEKRKGRKLNVELTAGGGGSKSKGRKEKIKAKNQKLTGERARKRKAEQEKAARSKKEKPPMDLNNQIPGSSNGDHSSIHPSRLSRVRQ